MGQKNCTLRHADEIDQLIGKYRTTADFEWLSFKSEIHSHISCSLTAQQSTNITCTQSQEGKLTEETCQIISQQPTVKEIPQPDMNKESTENCLISFDSDFPICESANEYQNVSEVSHSSCGFEVIEETALQTDDIRESVDIRISPRNSTLEIKESQYSNTYFAEVALISNPICEPLDMSNDHELQRNSVHFQSKTEDQELHVRQQISEGRKLSNHNTEIHKGTENCAIVCEKEKSCEENCTALNSNSLHPQKVMVRSHKTDSSKSGSERTSVIEKKIAEEIREMKQREEDLRRMREEMSKELQAKSADCSSDKKEHCNNNPSSSPNLKDTEALPKVCDESVPISKVVCDVRQKASTVDQTYKIASVFSSKHRDNQIKKQVKVVPQQESVVERDIRIAKEREQELKKQRENLTNIVNQSLVDEEKDFDSCTTISICSDFSFDSSRLTSPNSTDATLSTSNGKFKHVNNSSSESYCSLESLSESDRISNSSLLTKGSQQNVSAQDDLNPSSVDSSSQSSFWKPSFSIISQKPNLITTKKVDMERFLSSKGKRIVFKDSAQIDPRYSEIYEIKPPVMKKGTHRKIISAASKIQNELQEMKNREEEFKKERLLLDALNKATCIDSTSTKGHNEEDPDRLKKKVNAQVAQLERKLNT